MASRDQADSLVLVTGINGFIARQIGLTLLEKGFRLRGTVRRKGSARPLLDGAYKAFRSAVEIVEVADFTEDARFDKAVKGQFKLGYGKAIVDFQAHTL